MPYSLFTFKIFFPLLPKRLNKDFDFPPCPATHFFQKSQNSLLIFVLVEATSPD